MKKGELGTTLFVPKSNLSPTRNHHLAQETFAKAPISGGVYSDLSQTIILENKEWKKKKHEIESNNPWTHKFGIESGGSLRTRVDG